MANQIFCIRLRQINPTGKSLLIFRNCVKPLLQKYFCFHLTQISSLIRCLVPPEGRSRVVTTAGRDAVDVKSVRRATAIAGRDEPRERGAACRMIGAFCVRQNRVVLAPVAGAKFAEARRPDRADKTLIRG
jgi:hypothetical protein